MINIRTLGREIAERAIACNSVDVIRPVNFEESGWRNELLMFVKPEVFMVGSIPHIEQSLGLIADKLREFEVHVNGLALVGGPSLESQRIMDRHYGYINEISRTASTAIGAEDRQKIADALGLPTDTLKILGGHEYLAAHQGETVSGLDGLWFMKKSIKLRSGFYFQAYDKGGETLVLVNGFHPAQLAHFTDPTHRILLLLLHSNTPWANLRNDMVGATFPEKAVPGSIRGSLYAEPAKYGFETVSIANNGVHLSAGPVEGLKEIDNFFGRLLGLKPHIEQPLFVRRMVAAGFDADSTLGLVKNPQVTYKGKMTDVFSATEDLNTEDAITLLKDGVLHQGS